MHSAVQCCAMSRKSKLRKEEKMFSEKTATNFLNLFVKAKQKLYFNTNEALHTF